MLQATLPDMAKKRPAPSKGPGKPVDKNKPIIATLRGSDEFRAFLERAAKADRSTVAAFLERAAVRYARELGMTEEPPDR